jgi:hypothetical protein
MRRALAAALLASGLGAGAAPAGETLWVTEGNRLRVVEIESIGAGPLRERVLVPSASDDPARGRDVNGQICALPDGRFACGEDTGQPDPPAGWGVFAPSGEQVGKLTPTYTSSYPEPYGCALDAQGRLLTSEVGDPGFLKSNGQLLLWFPPFGAGAGFCRLAGDVGTAGQLAVDAEGRVYLSSASRFRVWRFLPPFPAAAGACGDAPARREALIGPHPSKGLLTYTGVALSPRGTLYVASVLTGRIAEFDLDGKLVRMVLESEDWLPPHATGTPQGLAVGADGTLYYADLDLVWEGWMPGPGPDGKVWRIRFGPDGAPRAPEVVLRGLAFPDGLAVRP